MNEDLLIAMAASVILATIKNASKKAKLKIVMAKIYKTIGAAYAGDIEFQKLAQ